MEHPMTIAEWQAALDAARAEKAALQARLIDTTHRAERTELALQHLHAIIAEECGKGDPVQVVRVLRDRVDAAVGCRSSVLTEAAAICRRRAGPFSGVGLLLILIEAAEEIEGLIVQEGV